MCGIAGLIHKGGQGNVGSEMTAMLQALKHRGPDSTGFALYGQPGRNEYVMRFKVAEQDDLKTGFKIGVNRSTNAQPVAGQEFDHSTYITVVDKTGTIRGHFDGYRGPNDTDGERYTASMTALKQLVADLLKE